MAEPSPDNPEQNPTAAQNAAVPPVNASNGGFAGPSGTCTAQPAQDAGRPAGKAGDGTAAPGEGSPPTDGDGAASGDPHTADASQHPGVPNRGLAKGLRRMVPLVALLGVALVAVQAVRPLPVPTIGGAMTVTPAGTFTLPWPEKGQAAVKIVGVGTLGRFGEQRPVPTASVAKIMTAYVVLRDHPLGKDETGPRIEVDARAVEEGGSKDESRIEGLAAGQRFSQRDMLKMLLIPSGNNIARLLARWDTRSRTETAFLRKMNDAARKLGMTSTTYTDPSGLDAGTVSTAADQLKLAEAVMGFDAFRAIVAMPSADIPGLPEPVSNNNSPLLTAGLDVRGIKTGSSTPAGGALSWASHKFVGGRELLILGTMMDQHVKGPDPNGAHSLVLVQNNSKKIITAVRGALTLATVVRRGQVVGHADDGLGGRTRLVATRDLEVVGVPGLSLELTVDGGGRNIRHGAKAGTVVGELTAGGAAAERVPVALAKDLAAPSLASRLTRLR